MPHRNASSWPSPLLCHLESPLPLWSLSPHWETSAQTEPDIQHVLCHLPGAQPRKSKAEPSGLWPGLPPPAQACAASERAQGRQRTHLRMAETGPGGHGREKTAVAAEFPLPRAQLTRTEHLLRAGTVYSECSHSLHKPHRRDGGRGVLRGYPTWPKPRVGEQGTWDSRSGRLPPERHSWSHAQLHAPGRLGQFWPR